MSELMGRSSYGDEYPWTWGISEDQLRLFEQHLQARYEPGITLEDLSEGELESIEGSYLAQTSEVEEVVPNPAAAQQISTVSVEELEALFALPDIDEFEAASEN